MLLVCEVCGLPFEGKNWERGCLKEKCIEQLKINLAHPKLMDEVETSSHMQFTYEMWAELQRPARGPSQQERPKKWYYIYCRGCEKPVRVCRDWEKIPTVCKKKRCQTAGLPEGQRPDVNQKKR